MQIELQPTVQQSCWMLYFRFYIYLAKTMNLRRYRFPLGGCTREAIQICSTSARSPITIFPVYDKPLPGCSATPAPSYRFVSGGRCACVVDTPQETKNDIKRIPASPPWGRFHSFDEMSNTSPTKPSTRTKSARKSPTFPRRAGS